MGSAAAAAMAWACSGEGMWSLPGQGVVGGGRRHQMAVSLERYCDSGCDTALGALVNGEGRGVDGREQRDGLNVCLVRPRPRHMRPLQQQGRRRQRTASTNWAYNEAVFTTFRSSRRLVGT